MATVKPFRRVSASAARVDRVTAGVYKNRRRFATGAVAVLAIGVGYHVVFGHNGLTVYEQKRQNEHALRQQLETLKQENESLKGHVTLLESDPDAIEHQAREELHYTRPGEVIYTLPPDPPAAAH
ncbi:septum formation initiator family protein [Granulicella sp. WH15]|uniref:FtsB family cell division protein n=1 Tax=Granulicella sp. WH15 TaxID=2602070 RepID=UPI0013676F7C|nr:septum formation initiator family protein [Granulicella sp. WH15]QHN04042.1 septum formation initiator family protein [Granulicella sp. WH15]